MIARDSHVNPLTQERERRARFAAGAIVVRLTAGEADAVQFARDRGYLPEVGEMRWREDGSASWRMRREDAYAWAEAVEDDPHAFCACLSRPLVEVFTAADFRIRDSWAV
jgi:hypothetical protein